MKTLQHIDLAYGQNRTWKTKSEFYEPNQQEVSYKYAEPEGLGYQKWTIYIEIEWFKLSRYG